MANTHPITIFLIWLLMRWESLVRVGFLVLGFFLGGRDVNIKMIQ